MKAYYFVEMGKHNLYGFQYRIRLVRTTLLSDNNKTISLCTYRDVLLLLNGENQTPISISKTRNKTVND